MVLSGGWAFHHERSPRTPLSIIIMLSTGEPDAGDLHVRFRGGGEIITLFLPLSYMDGMGGKHFD
ncbi:MAG: hypothetical protein HY693_04310 [Deltaproteobacteria bacterium]|nr:hypothetical protein [Deltaproteobacteria bacterium]